MCLSTKSGNLPRWWYRPVSPLRPSRSPRSLASAVPRLTNTLATAYSPAVETPAEGAGGPEGPEGPSGPAGPGGPWGPTTAGALGTGNRASFRGFWPLAHELWSRMLRSPRLSRPPVLWTHTGVNAGAFFGAAFALLVRASPPATSNVTPSSVERPAAATNTLGLELLIVTPPLVLSAKASTHLTAVHLDHGAMRVQRRSSVCLRRFTRPEPARNDANSSWRSADGSRTRWSRVRLPTSNLQEHGLSGMIQHHPIRVKLRCLAAQLSLWFSASHCQRLWLVSVLTHRSVIFWVGETCHAL